MNNQLTPVSWQTVFKKSLIWGIWLFFLAILQTTLFSHIRIFGAVPDLILPAVVAVAVYDKERTGTIAGIVGGVLIDALGGVGLSISPLVYMICGTFVALMTYSVLRRDFISWLTGTAASLIITGGFSVLSARVALGASRFASSDIWSELLIPQYFASLIMGVPVWFFTRLIWSKWFDNREMEG